MSLVFEALHSLEAERYGVFRASPPEALELLKSVERRVATNPEALSVGPDVDVHACEPAKLFPVPSAEPAISAPYAAAAAAVAMAVSAAAIAHAPERVAEVSPVAESIASMSAAPVRAVGGNIAPVSAAAASAVVARPAAAARVAAAPRTATTKMGRAVALLSAALPMVQTVLNLVDGNQGAAVQKALVAKPEAAPVARLTAPAIDLTVITSGLTALKSQQRELHSQVVEQNVSLKRIEGHLELVREATHRNTLEQKELIEDLRGVSSRINLVALTGLSLLAASVGINLLLYLRILKVL